MKNNFILLILTILFVNIGRANNGSFLDYNYPNSVSQLSDDSPDNSKKGPIVNASFGKGISILAADSSFSMKLGFRFQTLFVYEDFLNDYVPATTNFLVRRSRIKMDGFAFSPKLQYKVELAISNRDMGKPIPEVGNAPSIVLDAVLKWNIAKNTYLWFGQTKLPGNRERVISSQALQFVDRSLLNSEFNIDRDLGIQLHHSIKLGNMVINEIISVSSGEGRNITTTNKGGYDYTGRIEFLPFGKFSSKGDYVGGAIHREEKPKLSVAFGYDFNDDASRSKGQLGNFQSATTDLSTIMADLMFKYKGFSLMAEYMNKTSPNTIVKDTSGAILGKFETGSGFNIQTGYILKNNIEFAGRYTLIMPHKDLNENDYSQYTFCISKYFKEHNLKIQSDFSLLQENTVSDLELMFRLQVELAF